MQIIIPMSGSGARFRRAGYSDLKPLIEVDGKPIIEHVLSLFPGESDILFICAKNHLEETPLRGVLQQLAPSARIAAIEPHKLGPVHTVLEAKSLIRDDAPAIVNYCDFSAVWNYSDFKQRMAELNCAGCITAYRGFHPHSLGPNLYAYMREKDKFLVEIREKHCFTDARMNEYASAGTYFFRSGALLKHYFQAAIDKDLRTNGEYYASTPYNLMVEDGLDVYIYELDQFLQWGTPEDLEEYKAWSAFFSRYSEWKATLPTDGTNIIPMAGEGQRFVREGYSQPKPLVSVAGVPMIQRSVSTLPKAEKWIAICRADHAVVPELQSALNSDGRNVGIVSIPGRTEGAVCTCLLVRDQVNPEEPLLIAACDASVVWDEKRFAQLTSDENVDCLVWTFRNHPHANRNPRHYGWVEATSDGTVQRISCKTPISENVQDDPGIIGIFWFRRAQAFLDASDALIEQNRRINNEFYLDSIMDVLLEQGRQVKVFDVEHFVCYGVPDDVRTYEYWASYFQRTSGHKNG